MLPEAQAIRVTLPPGPEASVRLCYQWALECEDMSSSFDTQVWSSMPSKEIDYTVSQQMGAGEGNWNPDKESSCLKLP